LDPCLSNRICRLSYRWPAPYRWQPCYYAPDRGRYRPAPAGPQQFQEKVVPMFATSHSLPSFAATGSILAAGSRAQFRLLLKLPIGCRA
jgi:hypothetical protein